MPFGFDLMSSNQFVSAFFNKEISDNLKDNVCQLGERLKIGGSEVGQKLSASMSSVSLKVMELFQGENHADSLVEEATMDGPDWVMNIEICDVINHGMVNSVELIRGIKKRIVLWRIPGVQYQSLLLLDTVVKNCEGAFFDVAAGRVLDEMVKLIDDPRTAVNSRDKALMMIQSWGESFNELRYLPVYKQTYKSLKSRGIQFPCRDNDNLAPIFTPRRSVKASWSSATLAEGFSAKQTEEAFDAARNSVELLSTVLSSSPRHEALQDELTTTLIQQCRASQHRVQRIIETTDGNNETLLFEALNVNDEIQNVVSKYEDMKRSLVVLEEPERAIIPVDVEPEDSPPAGKEEEVDTSMIRKRAEEFMEGVMNMALTKCILLRNLLARPKQPRIQRKNNHTKMITLLSE